MIHEILDRWRRSNFDFRTLACPSDELRHLFDDWVPYYRLKHAIAEVLKPGRILEIGIRYGYSAAAFLNASPSAFYTGIDLDAETYGGTRGAIDWARRILPPGRSTLIVGNSQEMTRLPGGRYDLIHIDGQQDEDAVYHDLTLAMQQGTYALADGYFWKAQNFRGANEFLFRNKDAIEFYLVIPGYAGELLIKFTDECREAYEEPLQSDEGNRTSVSLRSTYTESYFLQDCGGYDSFKNTRGKTIADPRLLSVFELGNLIQPDRVLDLGCGRGELTYQFAKAGCDVTGIDYSPAAITLADGCFAGEPECARSVRFMCGNACETSFDGKFDSIIASDLVEHLSYDELSKLYRSAASHLSEKGLFVVHTYPNQWFYRYDYGRRTRIAKTVGAYLPSDPRSRYERLMHINEQSPRVLKRQLLGYFPHVLLWFGSQSNPGGSLLRRYSIKEMAAAPDLYALASKHPIVPAEVAGLWQMQPLPEEAARKIEMKILNCPEAVGSGQQFPVEVKIRNLSEYRLVSQAPYPVHVGYHWLDPDSGRGSQFEGQRTGLIPSIAAGEARVLSASVTAPAVNAPLVLQMRLVQENVFWFEWNRDSDQRVRIEAVNLPIHCCD